jgi:hypothetical protein
VCRSGSEGEAFVLEEKINQVNSSDLFNQALDTANKVISTANCRIVSSKFTAICSKIASRDQAWSIVLMFLC